MDMIKQRAAISGIGQSEVGRRLNKSGLELTVDAVMEALADAGLEPNDIDGISTWPGRNTEMPGFSPVGVPELKDALQLNLNWYSGSSEAPGQLGAVVNACMAVASGMVKHVICFRTITETSALAQMKTKSASIVGGGERIDGWPKYMVPFDAFSASNWVALYAQKHFHEYGTTREQLGQIAVNARRHAGLNPKAIYRDPITLDDYLSARMISSPLCLYDCDVPVDASTVIIISRLEEARDLKKTPIRFESIGCAHNSRYSWDQFDDLSTQAVRDASSSMWNNTDLKPADVDVAELYDGFSFICLDWLEQLGFCGKGEGGAFIEGGSRIALDGEIPLNTHGGQLSAGRTHGFGFMHEACTQLWGEGGERQVANKPQVAIASAGGGTLAASFLLTRE